MTPNAAPTPLERGGWLALCVALAGALYTGALHGPFVSDDFGYLVTNPYTASLSTENLGAMLDPRGPASFYTGNYAPVHLLLTALERQLFGASPLGYHLVNVGLHALCGWLLGLLLLRAGVGRWTALLGASFFLVHPANVEAVAWVSQSKTVAALALALGAWLQFERRPGTATLLFALALATKAAAGFALSTVALWWWQRAPAARRTRGLRWLGLWALLAAAWALPQLQAYAHLGRVEVAAYADPGVQLRSVFAVAWHYLVAAVSALGVSAFQEPAPAVSWLDPRWLAGALACAALGVRAWIALAAGRVEGVFWVAALAAFAPVSQVLPFLHPVADRYLYFILPGLVGAVCCAAESALSRGPAVLGTRPARTVAGLAAAAVLAGLGAQSAERARLWRGEIFLLLDAAAHYPDGGTAHLLRARAAAGRGDREAALASLRLAAERGVDRFETLQSDPALASLHGDPAFRAFLAQLAGRSIARFQRIGADTQPEWIARARAHLLREEPDRAVEALERALEVGGPWDARVRSELAQARARQAARRADPLRESP